ncbi:hypothetical protein [Pseudomonas shirazensis]|uniref:hypothetical protein n=1 Tax=Pseudomonas shirazensis TaxID=2745494 RepID=UPI003D2BD5F9
MASIMIEFDSWPFMLRISVVLTPVVIGMSGVALSFYIACTREFFVVVAALSSTAWIEGQKRYMKSLGLKSRWIIVCGVCGLLIVPGPQIRRGMLSVEGLKAFPNGLRKRMVASVWLTFVGFIGMIVVAAFIKMGKL